MSPFYQAILHILGYGARIKLLNPPSALFEGTGSDVDNNGMLLKLTLGFIG